MKDIIEYGNTTIAYSYKFTNRKTLAIEVHPDGAVVAIAPVKITSADVKERVEKRAPWIAKQLRHFRAYPFNHSKTEWVSGETIYYLGRQYRLKVNEGEEAVKLMGRFLQVTTKDRGNTERIGLQVGQWYLEHAKRVYAERFSRLASVLTAEKVKVGKLQTRQMKMRWGSCTKQGNILLNTALVKAPVYCIDYVILHEICHLKHHNHGPRFWAMLTRHCPEWVKAKDRLEQGGWNG